MKLDINGKQLEFAFGMGFLGELLEETNIDLEEFLIRFDKNPFKYIPICMYVSAKYAYEAKGTKIDFTKYNLIDWLELDGGLTDANKSVLEFTKAFSNSLFKNVPEDNSSKKGGTKKK